MISYADAGWRYWAMIMAVVCGAMFMTPYHGAAAEPFVAAVASSNPFSGNPEAIQQGRTLYFKWCAQCHGSKADGRSARFGKYAKDLRRFSQGFSTFVAVVVSGRPKKRMPAWGEVISAEEIAQIGAYLETLAIDGAKWKDGS